MVRQVFDIEEEFDSALDVDGNDGSSTRNQRRPSFQKGGAVTGIPFRRFNTTISAQSGSPLAQVFNPLVVGDNIEDSGSSLAAQPVVSYGPLSRRRITSTQKRPVEPSDQAHSTQLNRFPTISPPEHGILRSRSQDRTLKSKASNISDDEQHPQQQSEFMQRLDDIEKRQERIEVLLTQISQSISSDRS